MKTLITLVLTLLVPSQPQANLSEPTLPVILISQNCKKNPVFCKILKLKPTIDRVFALKLSSYIANFSKKFGLDPEISVAIAMQESSLDNRNRMGYVSSKDGYREYGVTDVGVFQIHVKTLANLVTEGNKIDLSRLETDVEYQAYWHAKILKSKIQTCKSKREKLNVTPGSEWSCYHSFTLQERRVYLKDVKRHLSKLVAI